MEYHSATKRDEVVSFAETWMDLESVMQNEVPSGREKQMSHMNVQNLEGCRGTYLQSRNGDAQIENNCVDPQKGSGE